MVTPNQRIAHREPLSAEGVVERIRRYRKDGYTLCTQVHDIAREMQRYAGRQQWPEHVARWAKSQGIPALVADDIGVLVSTMVGKQSMERLEPKILAEGDVLPGEAEAFSAFVKRVRELYKIEFHERAGFRHLWIQGLAALKFSVRYRNSRIPQIVVELLPIWETMWDPKAREQCLLDTSWRSTGRWTDATEFRRMHGLEEDFVSVHKSGEGQSADWPTDVRNSFKSNTDEVFVWTVEWRDVEPLVEIDLPLSMDQAALQLVNNGLSMGEALQQVTESTELLQVNPSEPKSQLPWQLSEEEWERFSSQWEVHRRMPFSDYWQGERDVYYDAVVVGDYVVKEPRRIPENGFTIHFMGDDMVASPEGWYPLSFVADLRDRQDFKNMSISGAIETTAKAPKGAFWHQPNAISDIGDFHANIGRPGSTHETSGPPGETWGTIEGKMFDGYIKLLEVAKEFQTEVTLDPYSTANVDDLRRVASAAVAQVTNNASQKHSGRFAALRVFREETTRHLIKICIAHFELADLVRLIGPTLANRLMDPETGMVDKRRWAEAVRFGVTVEESPYTAAEGDAIFYQLFVDQGGMISRFLNTPYDPGPGVMAEILKRVSSLPLAARQKWAAGLEAKEAAMAAQAQQQQQQPEPEPEQG